MNDKAMMPSETATSSRPVANRIERSESEP